MQRGVRVKVLYSVINLRIPDWIEEPHDHTQQSCRCSTDGARIPSPEALHKWGTIGLTSPHQCWLQKKRKTTIMLCPHSQAPQLGLLGLMGIYHHLLQSQRNNTLYHHLMNPTAGHLLGRLNSSGDLDLKPKWLCFQFWGLSITSGGRDSNLCWINSKTVP